MAKPGAAERPLSLPRQLYLSVPSPFRFPYVYFRRPSPFPFLEAHWRPF